MLKQVRPFIKRIPLLDMDTPPMVTPPALPFVCQVVSRSDPGVTYIVEIDENDRWTCSCPDHVRERAVPGRARYFCKHCRTVGYVTGLKRPRRWRRRRGEGWLIGELVPRGDGSHRMHVDGFVTSRELDEIHGMTSALIRRFLSSPDEEAVWDDDGMEGSCPLYAEWRVKTVLNSAEYQVERAKTERRRAGARKGRAKRAEKRAEKRAIAERAWAEATIECGLPLIGGKEHLGKAVAAPLSRDAPWSAIGSAGIGMARTILVCRRSAEGPGQRGLFVSLRRRPRSEMEATALARAITALAGSPALRALADGPYGGLPLVIGEEHLGELVAAPLSKDAPRSAIGIADFVVVQAAYQLAQGTLWLPEMQKQEVLHIPTATVQQLGQVGIQDQNIVGTGIQVAFDLIHPPSSSPTYPVLWGHNARRERSLVVAPDSEMHIKVGRDSRAAKIWETSSHTHHNANFRFSAHPLAVAFTEQRAIGGMAWANVRCAERAHEIAYSLWSNSTLGLLCYWWHANWRQAGGGSMSVSAIRTMPTLDVTRLTLRQLETAAGIFEDMRDRKFLPANEAYRDTTRQELDYRVLIEVLRLPESVLEPLELLRLKWCTEPGVHGGKRTAPPAPTG